MAFIYTNQSGGSAGSGIKGAFTFTASGTYTPSSGATSAYVVITGGGGGGGGAPAGINSSTGVGGAGGGTVDAWLKLTEGVAATIVIGAGGIGISAANGTNGSHSSITYGGTVIIGNGGDGGDAGPNDSGNRFLPAEPAASGSFPEPSVTANLFAAYIKRSQLGSGAIYSSASNTVHSGSGGDAYRGGAGIGKISTGNASENGASAIANSGAGGGGAYQTDNTNKKGGDGASGACLIIEY